MKAHIEKEPFNIKGVELVSEDDTEKLMLERLWIEHGGPAEFTRNDDDSVSLVIVPSPIISPLKAYWKDRKQDLGLCSVISVDFESNLIVLTNGKVRTSTVLENVELFLPIK